MVDVASAAGYLHNAAAPIVSLVTTVASVNASSVPRTAIRSASLISPRR